MDLDSVAEELYGLPPVEFIATRNARVKDARGAGDRDLATAIGGLRRPSLSAYLVNLLVRERRDLLEQLLELADALRAAQETLAGPELRALSSQRHRVIASVVGQARTLAASRSVRVSDAAERELEATFDAVLADPAAAEAVRSARLESALRYAGLGAAPTHPAPVAPQPRTQSRAAREAAEQVLQAAEVDAAGATEQLERARVEHDQAVAAQETSAMRVGDLTEQLEVARVEASVAATRVREQHRPLERAERKAAEAEHRLDRARAALAAVNE